MMAVHDIAMQLDVKVLMRDGVRLSADIYLPRGAPPVPAVLIRTPYSNNGDSLIERGRRLAASGYACVVQDCRGRWDSDGAFYPFREAADGYDTQEWVGTAAVVQRQAGHGRRPLPGHRAVDRGATAQQPLGVHVSARDGPRLPRQHRLSLDHFPVTHILNFCESQ